MLIYTILILALNMTDFKRFSLDPMVVTSIQNDIQGLYADKQQLNLKIELYNYYTRSCVYYPLESYLSNDVRNSRYYTGYRNKIDKQNYFVTKVDSNPDSIAADGVGAFSSALLPRGISSIEINYFDSKYRNYLSLTDEAKSVLTKMSGIMTKRLQYFLENQDYDFQASIFQSIGNYIEYGFSAIRYSTKGLVVYEPRLTWFQQQIGRKDKYSKILVGEITTIGQLKLEYLGICNDNAENKKIATVYYYYYLKPDKTWTKITYYEEGAYETCTFSINNIINVEEGIVKCDIYIANQDQKYLGYGNGDGVRALSSIIGMNYLNSAIRRGTELMTDPPMIMDSKFKVSHKDEDGRYVEGADMRAGAKNIVGGSIGTNPLEFFRSFLDGNPMRISDFQGAYMQFRAELEKAFSTDLLNSQPMVEETATAVNTRTAQAFHKIMGKANNYYRSIFIPVIRNYANEIIKDELKKPEGVINSYLKMIMLQSPAAFDEFNEERRKEKFMARYNIDVLSFEKQMMKEETRQKLVMNAQILASMGEGIAENDKVKGIIDHMMEELELLSGV